MLDDSYTSPHDNHAQLGQASRTRIQASQQARGEAQLHVRGRREGRDGEQGGGGWWCRARIYSWATFFTHASLLNGAPDQDFWKYCSGSYFSGCARLRTRWKHHAHGRQQTDATHDEPP
jgi:hypothetical protein